MVQDQRLGSPEVSESLPRGGREVQEATSRAVHSQGALNLDPETIPDEVIYNPGRWAREIGGKLPSSLDFYPVPDLIPGSTVEINIKFTY